MLHRMEFQGLGCPRKDSIPSVLVRQYWKGQRELDILVQLHVQFYSKVCQVVSFSEHTSCLYHR